MEIDEKRFFWLVRLYKSNLHKEAGVFSDFEKAMGFTHAQKTVRLFLKELLSEGVLILDGYRDVNNIHHDTYKIDSKKLEQRLLDCEDFVKEVVYFVDKTSTIHLRLR